MRQLGRVLLFLLGLALRFVVLLITGKWIDFERAQDEQSPDEPERTRSPRETGRRQQSTHALRPESNRQTSADLGDGASIEREVRALRVKQGEPSIAPTLVALETLGDALWGPVQDYARAEGLSLVERECVVLIRAPASLVARASEHTSLLPFVMPAGASGVEQRAWLARRVAGQLARDVPGLRQELRERRILEFYGRTPHYAVEYGERPGLLVGAWLDALCADALATCLLGPGYAWIYEQAMQRSTDPMILRLVRTGKGGRLHPEPPVRVRLEVVAIALERLGFRRAAHDLRGQAQSQASGDVLLLPLASGGLVALEDEFVFAEVQELLLALLRDPLSSLRGATWLDMPGVCYLHGEHGLALAAAEQLAAGSMPAAPARIVASAALLAAQADPRRAAELARLLVPLVGESPYAPPRPDESAPPSSGRKVGLRAQLHDRRLLREALVLGESFRPRGSPRAAGQRRYPSGR